MNEGYMGHGGRQGLASMTDIQASVRGTVGYFTGFKRCVASWTSLKLSSSCQV